MELKDQRRINASPTKVWAAILDPDVLKACVPGCESMSGSPETGYEAVVTQKVGPVSARFTGLINLSDMVPEKTVRISGEGKGGPAGFAKGGALVHLTADGNATILSYEVDAKIGGKLASLGSRVIEGFAKKMADQFFERFQAVVEGPAAAMDDAAGDSAPAPKKSWIRRTLGL